METRTNKEIIELLFNKTVKNCPFCGTDPDILVNVVSGAVHYPGAVYYLNVAVRCNECEIEKSDMIDAKSSLSAVLELTNDVLDMWNERAE